MSTVLLSQAVAEYLAVRSAKFSLTTVKNEEYVLRRFIATVRNGRDIQVGNLTSEHVVAWFTGLTQPHYDRSRIAHPAIQASTWNYYRTRINSFAEYCSRRGWTRNDLLAEIPFRREARKIRLQPPVSTLLAMLKATTDPRDRAVLACAMNTGLRASEIASIRVGDVDLDSLTLRVWISKSLVEDDMPITSDLASELHSWLSTYEELVGRRLQQTDFLLPVSSGPSYRWRTLPNGTRERYHAAAVYIPSKPVTKLHRVAQDALAKLGLPTKHEGIHTLRRAFARAHYDHLVGEGGHDGAIRVVMTSLHHTNVSTTEHYLGISSERRTRDQSLRGRSILVPTTSPEDTFINGDNVALLENRGRSTSACFPPLLLSC